MANVLSSQLLRTLIAAVAASALVLTGCGDDDTDGGGGDTDAGSTGGNDAGSTGGNDAGSTGGDDGAVGGGTAPVITRVEWSTDPGCTTGTASDFEIIVTVTDSDTPDAMLEVSGSVTGCTGQLDGLTSTISCPNAAPYTGNVTVTDPEDNSDSASFSFAQCENGGEDL